VIASDDGGLPETDCGGVVYVEPDNAEALAWGIRQAVASGPFTPGARQVAGTRFTVEQSVGALLRVFTQPQPVPPAIIVRQLEELVRAPSAAERNTPGPTGTPSPARLDVIDLPHSGVH